MTKAKPTIIEMRDGILRAMGPTSGPFYADGVASQLDAYTDRLRQSWERTARLDVEDRARAAIRKTIGEDW